MSKVETPAAETTVTPPAAKETPDAAAAAAAAKAAEGTAPPPEIKKADEVVPPAAPEKYEIKPRKDSPLLKSDMEEIEAAAKAQGLSNEAAQKMVEGREAEFDRFNQRQQQAYRDEQTKWRKEAETDKEIAGTDGKAFKENVEIAHRALNKFADDSFKKVLAESGLGNSPHLIRTFLRIGKGMAEDRAVLDGKSASPAGKMTREQKLYPTHSKEKKE